MDSLQPYLFMMMSSFKNDKWNSYSIYLYGLILILPFLNNIIPYHDIRNYIIKYLKSEHLYVELNIPSHEVPIIRGFNTNPVMKTIYSNDFLAVIHYLLHNNLGKLDTLTEIMTDNSELNIYYDENTNKKEKKYMYLPIHNKKMLISKHHNIYCEIKDKDNKDTEENDEKNKNKIVSKKKNFIITLSKLRTNSDISDMTIIENFRKECVQEYERFIKNSNSADNNLYIYEYKSCEKSESSIDLEYDSYIMEHNKDLEVNIFFEDKQKLISYITPFIYDPFESFNSGEEKYKRSGFTFKAGLLFYGAPGCGKTSTIKAILKYTNRHGIIINLSKVKTCDELQKLFRHRTIKGKELKGKQLCFILEDCDAFGDNVLSSRKDKSDQNEQNTSSDLTEIGHIAKLMTTATVKIMKDEDNLNLSCFLNILDGIIELHGVMIIMTTNHPEKIDEALIRPGRFDFKHEFKRASKKIIIEMLKFKFELSQEDIDKHLISFDIRDEILSPAEVQSICFKNDNINDCIKELLLASQK
jgi:SpoVK/Ycf46/Vps4 family AAA+-type ATPase